MGEVRRQREGGKEACSDSYVRGANTNDLSVSLSVGPVSAGIGEHVS